MKKYDFSARFGFVVNEVGRLWGRQFDALSREQLGLTRAQCRLIGQVASNAGDRPWTQAELAQRLDLTPMGVATLCDRMEAAGWITRRASPTDRRANVIELQPQAQDALERAMVVGDRVQDIADLLGNLTWVLLGVIAAVILGWNFFRYFRGSDEPEDEKNSVKSEGRASEETT